MKNKMLLVVRGAAILGIGVSALVPAAHARQVESNGVRPDTTVTITEHQNDGCGKYFLAWVSNPTYSTYQIWKKPSTATTYALYQTVADDFADVVVGTSGQYDFKIKAGTAFSAPVRLTGTKIDCGNS